MVCHSNYMWQRNNYFLEVSGLLVSVQPCRQWPSLQSSQLSHYQYKCCLRQGLLPLKHKHLWPTSLFMLKTGHLENWRAEVIELNVKNEEMEVEDDLLFDRCYQHLGEKMYHSTEVSHVLNLVNPTSFHTSVCSSSTSPGSKSIHPNFFNVSGAAGWPWTTMKGLTQWDSSSLSLMIQMLSLFSSFTQTEYHRFFVFCLNFSPILKSKNQGSIPTESTIDNLKI